MEIHEIPRFDIGDTFALRDPYHTVYFLRNGEMVDFFTVREIFVKISADGLSVWYSDSVCDMDALISEEDIMEYFKQVDSKQS